LRRGNTEASSAQVTLIHPSSQISQRKSERFFAFLLVISFVQRSQYKKSNTSKKIIIYFFNLSIALSIFGGANLSQANTTLNAKLLS
jgi:hypothetical protein